MWIQWHSAVRGNIAAIFLAVFLWPLEGVTPRSRQEEKTTGMLLLEFLFIRKAKAFPGSSTVVFARSHGLELLLRVRGWKSRHLLFQSLWYDVAGKQRVGMAFGRLCITYTVLRCAWDDLRYFERTSYQCKVLKTPGAFCKQAGFSQRQALLWGQA